MDEIEMMLMGQKGQKVIGEFLRRSGRVERFCQIDWLVRYKGGEWVTLEVKYQEPYTPPPFYGHGLPPYQVETRLLIEKELGVSAHFVVCDPTTHRVYWAPLKDLDVGEKHVTKTGKNVVYPLSSFEVIGEFDDKGNIT